MEVATWCDKHNLPPPKDGELPAETGRYLTVCMYRRPDEVPVEVVVFLLCLMREQVAEA